VGNWMTGGEIIGASIGIEKRLDLIHKNLEKLILVLTDLVDTLKNQGKSRDIEE